MSNVVEVENLSRHFGTMLALNNICLQMQPGLVYGLVGANGPGKTTLMKHLLGLLRAKHGSVRVFGMDPVQYPVRVLARVGYLSEDRDLPEWMRINELKERHAARDLCGSRGPLPTCGGSLDAILFAPHTAGHALGIVAC